MCLAERSEMLAAAQFPRDFHIGGPIELGVLDVAGIFQWPLASGFEISRPGEGVTERHRTRTEQIELVHERSVRCSSQVGSLRRIQLGERTRPLGLIIRREE